MSFKDIINVWKVVFSNKRYVVLSLLVALIFYKLSVLVPNFNTVFGLFSQLELSEALKTYFLILIGFWQTIKIYSFIGLILISLLLGMLVSLIVFKIYPGKMNSGKTGIFASIGAFIGAIAPGCAACGLGILPIIGLSTAFLTFLPFEGFEISILSLIILGLTILKVSKDLTTCEVCKIHLTMKNERGFNRYGRK